MGYPALNSQTLQEVVAWVVVAGIPLPPIMGVVIWESRGPVPGILPAHHLGFQLITSYNLEFPDISGHPLGL